MESKCPVHQVEWVTIPAGVSKKTGKEYPAFKACPEKGCQEKPPKVFTQPFKRPPGLPPKPEEYLEATKNFIAPNPTLGFSRSEIDEWLKKLPSLIARQAEVANNKQVLLDKVKHELKVREAVATTEHSRDELNANEKLAAVVMDEDVQEAEKTVISIEAAVRGEKIKLDELVNKFDALRKAANILVAEMTHMKETV